MDRDVYQRLQELPYRRLLDVQQCRINDMNRKLDEAGWGGPNFNQYPAKRKPAIYSRVFGPFGLQTPRRLGASGYEHLAPLVTPAQFTTPRTSNIVIGREKAFYLTRVNVAAMISWTWTSDPAGLGVPVDTRADGDLFDSLENMNGGAQMLMNHSGTSRMLTPDTVPPVGRRPKICFDVELYDRRRGRVLSDGRIPGEVFVGGAFENKPLGGFTSKRLNRGYRFDFDTELEPRVYINEISGNDDLDISDAAYNAATFRVWLNLAFFGYHTYALEPNGLWHELGEGK